MEEALKKSLEQIGRAKREWESTVDSLASFICLLDQQGHVMRANRTVERWQLASVVEVKGRELHELLHPGCASPACYLKINWPQTWADVVCGQSVEYEAADEVLKRHLHFQFRPISAQPNQREKTPTSLAVVIVEDITKRKRTEAALQQAYDELERRVEARTVELAEKIKEEQRQREIVTILAEVVASVSLTLSTDELLNHILVKLQQLVAYDSAAIFLLESDNLVIEAARGFEVNVLNHRHAVAQDPLFQTMLAQKCHLSIADTYADPRYQFWPGSERVRSRVGAPLLVAQQIIGYLAVDRHLPFAFTEADADLVQAFAHQVAQTISNARLFADLKEAQAQLIQRERLAALGQMAATVAHELRNPLMAVRMGVEYLLRDVSETDPRRRGATLMQTSIDRINRIVEDILHVARAPHPVLTPGLLQTAIEAEVSRWELLLTAKKITCHMQFAPNLPPLLLDPDQIVRVFSNLIGNSADVLPSGGEISISLALVDQSQVVIFADNGPGMPPEHLPRIFEPFFTTKSRGTGLGLYIIKQIIEYHGGSITVWSEPGLGTKFTISLPLSGGK
ncbi:MAG: GAF domain-containing protein [Chloroflexi bacterium]|nr:GAF domain-containing protein [Chloroflexota bacterium]